MSQIRSKVVELMDLFAKEVRMTHFLKDTMCMGFHMAILDISTLLEILNSLAASSEEPCLVGLFS